VGSGCEQSPVLERDAVAVAVASLLDTARRGAGSALFVIAEAGLGKSTTLTDTRRRWAIGFDVRVARGDADETMLPFGVTVQALGSPGTGDGFERLGGTASPFTRSGQFHAMLRSLTESPRPVLLALDDLHWADKESLDFLSFLCRRIDHHPVAVLATLRPWPPAAGELATRLLHDGVARIERLCPLSEEATAALLATRSGRPASAPLVRRLWRLCAGNPLLLGQMAIQIASGGRTPTAAAGAVQLAAILRRFAGVPAAGLRYCQAASVLGIRFRPQVAAALSELDNRELELAVNAVHRGGLMHARDARWARFTHPLFRQALYQDLPAPERSRLHRTAFRLLSSAGVGVAEAVPHAVRGRMVGEPDAVAALERAGLAARQAGAVRRAIAHFQAAVELAGDTASLRLPLALGELLVAAGKPGRAAAVYRRLLGAGNLSGSARADVLRMLGRALTADGRYAAGEAHFLEAADSVQGEDPRRAAEALLDHASVWLLPPRRGLASAVRARELAEGLDEVLRARAVMAWAHWSLLTGDPAGIQAAATAAAVAERHADADRSWYLGMLGSYHHLTRFVEDFDASQRAFDLLLGSAESARLSLVTRSLLVSQVDTLNRLGRPQQALALLERAEAIPHPNPPMVDSVLAMARACVLQLLGRTRESQAWWERANRDASARGEWPVLLWLWCIRGRQWLHDGHVADACELYRRIEELSDRQGLAEPCVVPWARDGVRAYVGSGRLEDAERVLAWLEGRGRALPCRWPRIAAHAGRAALAERRGDLTAAEAHFDAALALHQQVPLPLERARTLIDYGGFLRRSRRVVRARRLLAEAVVEAERAAAGPLAQEAGAELRIAGGRRRRDGGPAALTPQEVRVARLAAGGATNAEIAQQLVISIKTVESHLGAVYGKRGIGSRRELRALGRSLDRDR
jgi:ATP/maltotriose-dependent transcriptional regulator MalT